MKRMSSVRGFAERQISFKHISVSQKYNMTNLFIFSLFPFLWLSGAFIKKHWQNLSDDSLISLCQGQIILQLIYFTIVKQVVQM